MEEGHIQTTLHVPPDGGYGWSLFCQAFFSTGVWSPPCLCSGCFSGQNLTNLKRLPQKNDYHVRWTSRATTQWKICRVLWNQLYHHWLAHLCILYQYSFSGSWVWSCLWYWDRSCGYQWYLNYQQIFQEKNCSCLCFICFSCGSCGWWRVGSKLPDLEKVVKCPQAENSMNHDKVWPRGCNSNRPMLSKSLKNQSDSMLTKQSLWKMCQNSKFCISKVQICPVSLAGGQVFALQPPYCQFAT